MEVPELKNNSDFLEKAAIVEAMIFSANEPVEAKKIVHVYNDIAGSGTITASEVYTLVAAINERYSETGRPFQIFEWGGGFRLATRPEYAPYIKTLHEIGNSRRLSRSLTETLAIVAYKQPVTKPEIDFVRGVDSDYAIRRLMELDLVDVIGRSESVGKPLLYGTTSDFLEKFGLNTVDDLPSLREIEDLIDDPAFNRERAELLMSKGLSLLDDTRVEAVHEDGGTESAEVNQVEMENGSADPLEANATESAVPDSERAADGPADN